MKPATAVFHSAYIRGDHVAFDRYGPFTAFFSEIEKRFSGPVRILDVGCGSGHFVAECLRRGHDVWGVEIDPTRADDMPPKVHERVFFQSADQLPEFSSPFQVIAFWDSFEHFQLPFAVIESLRKHISMDGVVFMRVNNTRDIFNWVSLALLRFLPSLGRPLFKACYSLPEHFWNFSLGTMSQLCEKSEWRIERFRATETPALRFTNNLAARGAIEAAYMVNRLIGGGKIGEYWLTDDRR